MTTSKEFEQRVLDALNQIDLALDALMQVEGSISDLESLPENLIGWVDTTKSNVDEFSKRFER